jgi:hypothetical protein
MAVLQNTTISGNLDVTGTLFVTTISASNYTGLTGGGDVILSASNTFTGVNTFNTNFITASVGITGSTAQFTSITGSTFFSASNPSYWTGTAPTNLQDAINRVAAAIFNGITGSIA